jgi:hypothetical protein
VVSKKYALLHDACILDEEKMEKLRGMNVPMPKFLQEDIPEGVRGIYGYRNLQTFYPTLSKVFRLNKYQSARVAYNLPAKLIGVDCSGAQGFCRVTLEKDGALEEATVFMKVTHLLDPIRWMRGRYSLPQEAGLPGHSKTWTSAWHKLQDPWNQAYVEALATYALSNLRTTDVSPHFNQFYGAYCARADMYHFNINEDYESFRNTRWFWNGKERGLYDLFVLNGSSPDVSPPEEVLADILTKPDFSDESHVSSQSSEGSEEELDAIEVDEIDEDASLESASMDDKSFKEEEEDDEESDQYIVYASIPDFPVMLIFTESNENTMDSLLDPGKHRCKPGTIEWETMWAAWIFQVIAALCVMQKVFGMTHNDLHTNNIVWSSTEKKFLFYKSSDGSIWKVPTYGKIFRLIDFGRSIFSVNKHIIVSDDFRPGNDADGQYAFKPLTPNAHEVVGPNPSFDLSRLAVSLFESVFPIKPIESDSHTILSEEDGLIVRETVSPLYNCIWSWMVDDDDKNILMEPDGGERFPDFDLYKHIAAKVHNAQPADQIHKLPFSQFKTLDKVEKAYSLFI